jgi:hypothetical protein
MDRRRRELRGDMRARRVLVVVTIGISICASRAFGDDQTTQKPPAPRPTPASSGNRMWPSRAYIAVDGGYQVHSLTFSETHHETVFAEDSTWSANYRVKNGVRYEVGGGIRVWRNLLGAVTYSFYEDTNPAALSAAVPHPFRFSDPRSISAESSPLRQSEQAIHVSAAWMTPVTRHLELGFFGGPSVFRVKRSLVDEILYTDTYPYDTITFTRAASGDASKAQIGGHAGVDATWLFTRRFGIGGAVRYTTATVDLATPAGGSLSLKVGGFQAGAGLRLRLGEARAPRGAPGTPRRNPRSPQPLPAPPGTDVPRTTALTAVTLDATPVYISAAVRRTPLKELPANTRVRVLSQKGEWTQIEFDDKQWGRRVGYVQTKHLRLEKGPQGA